MTRYLLGAIVSGLIGALCLTVSVLALRPVSEMGAYCFPVPETEAEVLPHKDQCGNPADDASHGLILSS